ncbi:isochorismatase family protein [Zooshikella harenae]|uniref:isochorismatase n=1 Tax=Zooshikella harenae TaxID=2827238 RepID=A0ABS5ZAU3_9GAMM|nr:isochorismatase family protein [Zooshikella harenae]MBU2711119.1 isochorismatase family protein [Zooshikella harenae]
MTIPRINSYEIPSQDCFNANKVKWSVDPKRAVLLVHDMQQYFLDFYGENSSLIATVIEHVQHIKQQLKALGVPVYYSAQPGNQTPQQRALLQDFWGKGLADDPNQTAIISELAPEVDDQILTKWRYSAFQRTDLLQQMRDQERDQLIICGVYAHIGCQLTAADAFMNDIQAFFVTDAIADFSYDEHLNAVNYVAQRCGYTLSTASLLDSLVENNIDHTTDDAHNARLHNVSTSVYSVQQENIESKSAKIIQQKTPVKTMDNWQQQVAKWLDVELDELAPDDNLIELGLDSIRVMSLLEQWQQQGVKTTLLDLAENPTLSGWEQLVTASQAVSV